jgi:hypothetical protein
MPRSWNTCSALREKSSVPLLTEIVQSAHAIRAVQFHCYQFHSRCLCGTQRFLTTDHNFTDSRHALSAHDHAQSWREFLPPEKRDFSHYRHTFLSPI